MQHAVLNRATIAVAETTEVSGRVTADSIKHGFCAKKQSDLLRICASAIFGCVVSVGVLVCLAPMPVQAQLHQGFVDPIVGSWIVHVEIDTFIPPIDGVTLPLKVDNVANLGADGNTADFDPGPPSRNLYGPWVKVGDRIYRQKIVSVDNMNHTITTAYTGPLILNEQGDQIRGPMHTIVTDANDGHIIQQWSGPLVFDRIKFSLPPSP
jgi:hypothetical protein